jgi:UDP-glucose 4-epimerase
MSQAADRRSGADSLGTLGESVGNRYSAPVPSMPASGRVAPGPRRGDRTLIIGCGFIGSHVVAELAARGRSPVVLTRSLPASEVTAMIDGDDLHLGDAGDPEAVEAALVGVGHVAFCAGGLLPAASEQDPALDTELTLPPLRTVLAALRKRPGVSLTYLSSGGTAYGEPKRIPVREEDATRPISSYGRLHLACEATIAQHREEFGLRARVLRCSTVYGEYQRPDRGQGAVATFLHRIGQGDPIDLYGGGSTIRDYVYAGDVARVLIELIGRDDGPPTLHVAAGEGTSLLQLLRLVERQIGRPAQVVAHPERRFDVHRIVLDTTRMRELVDFEPTTLPVGIARTHAWLTAATAKAA